MKKLLTLFLTLSFALTACGSTTADSTTASTTTTDAAQTAPVVASEPLAVSYADEDQTPASAESAVKITLAGDSISVDGSGATANGSTVTITAPGIYAVTSRPLVKRTRATLRKAEFGFFGVLVITWRHTPRRCGHFVSAGDLDLETGWTRPLRTSWLMVGI